MCGEEAAEAGLSESLKVISQSSMRYSWGERERAKWGQCMSTWDIRFIYGSLPYDLKALYSAPGNCKCFSAVLTGSLYFLNPMLFNCCRYVYKWKAGMKYELYELRGLQIICAWNFLNFMTLVWLVFTVWHWARGREALFALKWQWERVGEKRFSWCYPESKMDRGEDTVYLAQLYPTAGVSLCGFDWRCTFSFFISVYLWFICFSKAGRTSRLLPLWPDV